jgi:TetR/AcrR family transcriptional regulator, regulator of biofilm formation and stress response
VVRTIADVRAVCGLDLLLCTFVHMRSEAPAPPVTPRDAVARSARRARRWDPNRKDRILDVALDVIAEHGVAGATHRLIAAAADVSPGSLTYYFDGISDLLEQAFRRHAARGAAEYERHFQNITNRAELVAAVTGLIVGSGASSGRDSVITFELYLAARREPALRVITEEWLASSRAVLQRYSDASTAKGLDALIEGLTIHMLLSTRPVDRAQIATYVDRALGESPASYGQPQ